MLSAGTHPYSAFIHRVEKPARYLGGEFNSVVKDWSQVTSRFALCFPDLYDIGMSHLGTKILYSVLNKTPDLLMERCFCPWTDMEAELRAHQLPLLTLETHRPLSDFDVVGFSLQYELTFTNVLLMLDLGGVPLLNQDRTLEHPLVIAGGPTATHAEPMAPFIDVFLLGDAEERLPALLREYAALKTSGLSRTEILIQLSKGGGLYCPDLYERAICERSGLLYVDRPKYEGVPERVQRAFLDDISRYRFPDDSPVAVAEAIFDRMSIEIARGCTEGCRFCQAGMIYRPVRERDPEEVVETLVSAISKGGYDEAAITSLSTADYSCISPLIKKVMERLRPMKVSLGISSLRAYGLSEDLLDEIATVKATGLTFAPEAGSQRMRDVINKNISEEDILTTSHRVFSKGWQKMKFYFIIGLPTETAEDVDGITELAHKALSIGRKYQRGIQVTVSVSSHVPKPHTPFQWAAMDPMPLLDEKQEHLFRRAKQLGLKFKRHPLKVSHLEGIISRGDRRVGQVILEAFQAGARFDSWDDKLQWQVWQRALEDFEAREGISRTLFLNTLPTDARLPWDHIDMGLEDGFLLREYQRAVKSRLSPPCGKPVGAQVHPTNLEDATADQRKLVCYNCGIACDLTQMRDERARFLTKLGALHREAPPTELNAHGKALKRVKQGLTPHDFQQGQPERYRLRLTKLGAVSLQSHLDLVRTLPQILRRAELPMFYSEGYNPKPIQSFGPALALGVRSMAEYADVTLTEALPVEEVLERLAGATPEGMVFTGARRLAKTEPAIGRKIQELEYLAVLPEDFVAGSLDEAIAAMRSDGFALTVLRRGESRILALEGLLRELAVTETEAYREHAIYAEVPPGRAALRVVLEKKEDGPTPKPSEIVEALIGRPLAPVDLLRVGCFGRGEAGRFDPIAGEGLIEIELLEVLRKRRARARLALAPVATQSSLTPENLRSVV